MLVLIDQCGCPGFRFTKGSTPFLVIGLVVFRDFAEAERAAEGVTALAKELSVFPSFRFNKTSHAVREQFIDAVCDYDFELRALIADKRGMSDPAYIQSRGALYEYLISSLTENNADVLSGSSVKVNKNVDRHFRDSLTEHLQKLLQPPLKFKCTPTGNDALMQLTDMVTGTLAKNFTDESVISFDLLNRLVAAGRIKSVWKIR